MYIYIHKPKGEEISQETRNLLLKKYGHGFMVFSYKDGESWKWPVHCYTKNELEQEARPFDKDVESLIYYDSAAGGSQKPFRFTGYNKEENIWHMFFPSEFPSFEITMANSMRYPFSYQNDSAGGLFHQVFLEPLSNLSKIRLMKSLLEKDGTESALICNGEVHFLTKNSYVINGVKFSSLDFENDLPFASVGIIALSLTLFNFLKGNSANPKEEKSHFEKMPHRELKSLAQEAGIEDFWKNMA